MEPPDPNSIEALVKHGRRLIGRELGELMTSAGHVDDLDLIDRGKGGIGQGIQLVFGLGPDNRAEADFPDATGESITNPGLELKIVPMVKRSNQWKVKERQVIGMVNYDRIIAQEWSSSDALKKLKRVLNVFVTHEEKHRRAHSRIIGTSLWEPDSRILPVLRRDWDLCKNMVVEERAHELSERLFNTLSPARKGAGGDADLVRYGSAPKPAFRRAFSLKVAFMNGVWTAYNSREPSHWISNLDDGFNMILSRLSALEGRTTEDIVESMGIEFPRSKDFVSVIVRRWLTGGERRRRIAELDDRGIILKTVPLRTTDHRPWEATSFPAMSIRNLIECDAFTDHFMSDELNHIIFQPTLRTERSTERSRIRFGRFVEWKPDAEEWKIIEEEWTMYRDILRRPDGAESLPSAKGTRILHMRPKAANATQRDVGPWGDITRQCFWLNQEFVQSILCRAI